MKLSTNRNPIYNRMINPIYNRTINPIYNRTINPIYNRMINPIYNRTINPIYNRTINPIYNRTINPIYNRDINPIYNRDINPIYNRDINPIYSLNFDGLFLFDLSNEVIEYIILRNEFLFAFNLKNTQTKFGVKHDMNGYVLFNTASDGIGHLENNSINGFNYFDNSSNWLAFLT